MACYHASMRTVTWDLAPRLCCRTLSPRSYPTKPVRPIQKTTSSGQLTQESLSYPPSLSSVSAQSFSRQLETNSDHAHHHLHHVISQVLSTSDGTTEPASLVTAPTTRASACPALPSKACPSSTTITAAKASTPPHFATLAPSTPPTLPSSSGPRPPTSPSATPNAASQAHGASPAPSTPTRTATDTA